MNSYSYIESDEERLKELLDKLDETIDLLTGRNIYYKELTNELKRQLRIKRKYQKKLITSSFTFILAFTIMASAPLALVSNFKKRKDSYTIIPKTTYTYEEGMTPTVNSEEVLLSDVKDEESKKVYIILTEPYNKLGYRNIITYDVSDIELPSPLDYYDLDLTRVAKTSSTMEFSNEFSAPILTNGKIFLSDEIKKIESKIYEIDEIKEILNRINEMILESKETENIEESKKLIIETLDYDNAKCNANTRMYLSLVVMALGYIILEAAYKSEYEKGILNSQLIKIQESINEISNSDNINILKANIDILINTINNLISMSEELTKEWNSLFSKNKYLLSDPSELLERYDELIRKLKQETMTLKK